VNLDELGSFTPPKHYYMDDKTLVLKNPLPFKGIGGISG